MNPITLETPFGAVPVSFESYVQCLVRLPDKDTAPPTASIELKGRTVCGDFVFELREEVWQFQPKHRFNYCE